MIGEQMKRRLPRRELHTIEAFIEDGEVVVRR
jgi:hypothetical protein